MAITSHQNLHRTPFFENIASNYRIEARKKFSKTPLQKIHRKKIRKNYIAQLKKKTKIFHPIFCHTHCSVGFICFVTSYIIHFRQKFKNGLALVASLSQHVIIKIKSCAG